MNVIPPASRLNFVASARSAFDFVTNPPYSLRLVDQDEGRVTYAGVDLGLAILYDGLSCELDLALWRESVEAEVTHPYTMVDLLRVADPDRARSYRQFSASTEAAVEQGLAMLESEFRRFGLQALSGSREFFERMRQMRSLAAAEFNSELEDKQIREKAGRAWRDRDFSNVVKQYSILGDRLSQVERARLDYARRHLRLEE
ncbi:MAG TPA: hypothetical protein VF223_18895 [Trebonia sp.]